MKRTRICDLLGIDYPIIQGGMSWIANAELAAAVSEAGGLGLISPNAAMEKGGDQIANLRQQIKKARALTDRPVGINLPLTGDEITGVSDLIATCVQEGVTVMTTSAGDPMIFAGYLKAAGARVLHVVASVAHARRAEAAGVDVVIAEGYEAGGHNGRDELPTMVLVPQVVDAVNIPVIAAGGIAEARGLVAALALGAEGVQIGTRFVATLECCAHPAIKKAIVEAIDTGTVITARKLGPTRVLKNQLTARLLEMEAAGASAEELVKFLGSSRSRLGQLEGDLAEGEAYCGAIAGMIKEVVAAGDVVRSIVADADKVLARLT
ncbi:MAG: nitronate monooxygenase [Chloroflexi bacterium]|nr:nitronate monooxygenase [Chloroflexota bacterium]